MGDEAGGAAAEVGVRKVDSEGNTVQEEGAIDSGPPLWAWVVWLGMLAFDVLGVWKLMELLGLSLPL